MKEERLVAERRKSSWRKYLGYGVTAFCVIAAAIVLVFVFVRIEDIGEFFNLVRTALTPVIYGVIFAYLMNPLMSFFEKKLLHFLCRHAKRQTRAQKAARAISIIITLLIVLTLIAFLVYLLAPELSETIVIMIEELPTQVDSFLEWFNGLLIKDNMVGDVLQKVVTKGTVFIEDFIENSLLSTVSSSFEFIATGVWGVFNIVYYILIGLIFSIYMLASKERFAAQSKKFLYACLKRKRANSFITTCQMCHKIFTGAITGKIIDSVIVGLLCFVGMTVLDLPYAALISVIVGVTNVIPFFGPYIGTIPSALLILFVDPLQCLYFLVFIIILQQLDCNILDPRIVGGSIGLSPFWVLFACVVFGGMFGLPGMLLGVPAFACIYMIIKAITERRLHKKGLKTATEDYTDVDYLPEEEMVITLVDVPDMVQGAAEDEEASEQ